MKVILSLFIFLISSITTFSQDHVLKIVVGKFAFCGASGATLTGKKIVVQGKEFLEGVSVCPVINGPSIASTALVPNPTITPDGTKNTVWSFFWYFDSVPQAPNWETLPTVNRSFVVSREPTEAMSNMFCMPCEIWKEVNGVTLAKCYGPVNEAAVPLRRALRVLPGMTSITQAPVGTTYSVGTPIPVVNSELNKK